VAQSNVSNFLAQVLSGGMAKPNRFEVTILNAPCVSNSNWGQRVSMFCDSTSFPTRQIITSRQQLFGPPEFLPTGINTGGDSFGMQFYLDRSMTIKQYFDSWMNGIIDPVTYTANYKQNYITQIYISQLDEADQINYTVKLIDAYPTTLSPVTLDYALGNQVARLNVSFHYRTWQQVSLAQGQYQSFGNPSVLGSLQINRGNITYLTNQAADLISGIGGGISGTQNASGTNLGTQYLV